MDRQRERERKKERDREREREIQELGQTEGRVEDLENQFLFTNILLDPTRQMEMFEEKNF